MAALVLVGLALAAFPERLCPPAEAYPVSDYAKIELYTRLAAEGAQRVGTEARFHFHHPGPSFFYFAAPFYRLSGNRSAGLGLAALAWHLLALIVLVRCAGRLAPAAGAALMTLAWLSYLHSRGLCWLLSSWNPNTAMLPFAVALLASAILATGEGWALPLFVLSASAAVQSHVVLALPAAACGAPGVVLGCWPRARRALGVPDVGRGPGRGAWLAALAAAGLMWTLPVQDELGSDYRNFHRILSQDPRRAESRPWPEAASAVLRILPPLPIGSLQDEREITAGAPKVTPAQAFASVLIVAAIVLAGWWGSRRRSPCTALAWLTALALAAAFAAARYLPGRVLPPYLLQWVSILGLMALFLVAAEAAARFPALAARAAGFAGWIALLLLAAGLLLDTRRLRSEAGPQQRSAASLQVEQLATRIERQLPQRTPTWVLVRVSREVDPGIALGLILALDKARLHLRVAPFGSCRLVGHFVPQGDETSELLVGEVGGSPAPELLASAGTLNVYWRPSAAYLRGR